MNSYDIKKALAARHRHDMFFEEVKDGPTQTVRHHAKIDALAMTLSWTNFAIIGYEIKVSRGDFLRDEKWRAYLPMCHQLYFIAPKGVLDPSEVGENCGVMVVGDNGRIRTLRKAPHRDIELPTNMLLHLMFKHIGEYERCDNKKPRPERLLPNPNIAAYKAYLEGRAEVKSIGHALSKRIRQEIDGAASQSQRAQMALDRANRSEKELRVIYDALGIIPGAWNSGSAALGEITRLKSAAVPKGVFEAERDVRKALEILTGLTKPAGSDEV